jgi:hypothetical protein
MMRLDKEQSREDVLAELQTEAERTWGVARAKAIGPALEATAGALWRLAQAPIEPLGPEPAFIGPSVGGEG